jgi:aspartyl-tRNA(Asn)/glutamyl-tRNA(Gln) amidotransferase subunit B
MYPDTDTPPLPIADATVERVRARIPETPWSRQARYEALGLAPADAWRLAGAAWAETFDALRPRSGELVRRLAATLRKRVPFHRRRGRYERLPPAERLAPMVRAMEEGAIRPEATDRIFDELIERWEEPAEEILTRYRRGPDDERELERELERVSEGAAGLAGKPFDAVMEWGMGRLMACFLGRLEPSYVRERLSDALQRARAEAGA